MRQTRTRPFVHPDPVPPPLSLGSSLPATSPLDTSVEEIALVEMASPIPAFASVVWESNSSGHRAFLSLLLLSQATDYRLTDDICILRELYPVPLGANYP